MSSTDPRLLPFLAPAITSHAKFYPRGPYISITLAQLAIESAYGTRTAGHNNFFGIKATTQQVSTPNGATRVLTKEYINGSYVTESLYFANYPTPADCFDAHATLLTRPWFQRCIDATTVEAYAEALHTCGYATAPNYADAVLSVIAFNNLKQYDPGA